MSRLAHNFNAGLSGRPITAMSDEILLDIFTILATHVRYDEDDELWKWCAISQLRQVCRSWRTLVDMGPRLWTVLDARVTMNKGMTSRFLSKSGCLPLHVVISGRYCKDLTRQGPDQIQCFTPEFLLNIYRIRTFEAIQMPARLLKTLENLLVVPAPQLTKLRIGGLPLEHTARLELFSSQTPRLRELSLVGFTDIRVIVKEVISLDIRAHSLSTNELINALRKMPHLTHLRIDLRVLNIYQDWTAPPSSRVMLDHLQSLTVATTYPQNLAFLPDLQFPATTAVTLAYWPHEFLKTPISQCVSLVSMVPPITQGVLILSSRASQQEHYQHAYLQAGNMKLVVADRTRCSSKPNFGRTPLTTLQFTSLNQLIIRLDDHTSLTMGEWTAIFLTMPRLENMLIIDRGTYGLPLLQALGRDIWIVGLQVDHAPIVCRDLRTFSYSGCDTGSMFAALVEACVIRYRLRAQLKCCRVDVLRGELEWGLVQRLISVVEELSPRFAAGSVLTNNGATVLEVTDGEWDPN